MAFRIDSRFAAPSLSGARLEEGEDEPANEASAAAELLEVLGRRSNLDDLHSAEPELREKATMETADLLGRAGYDRDAYLSWVEQL